MLHRSGSRSRMSGSGPTYMSNEQMGDYLHNLRSNPVIRPKGSRPLHSAKLSNEHTRPVIESGTTIRTRSSLPVAADQSYSHLTSLQSEVPIRPSSYTTRTTTTDEQASHSRYVEREQRQHEKREVHDLRLALEGVDLEEERRMHETASEEAAELIWKHRNPGAPYRLASRPRESIPSRTGSYTLQKTNNPQTPPDEAFENVKASHRVDRHSSEVAARQKATAAKPVPAFASPPPINQLADRRRTSGSRKSSGSINSKLSFPNAEERIYEDSMERSMEMPAQSSNIQQGQTPAHVRRNPFARARESRSARLSNMPFVPSLKSRADKSAEANAAQTTAGNTDNTDSDLSKIHHKTDSNTGILIAEQTDMEKETRYRDGVEIRSDELRAATSMKLSDRSSRLPSPVIVTDNPERPIVSFRSDWNPPPNENQQVREGRQQSTMEQSSTTPPQIQMNSTFISDAAKPSSLYTNPSVNNHNAHRPNRPGPGARFTTRAERSDIGATPLETGRSRITIPVIRVEETPTLSSSSVPAISVDEPPSIVVSESKPKSGQAQLSSPEGARSRNHGGTSSFDRTRLPQRNAEMTSARSQFHMTPSVRRQTALCAQCALPISGKIVSAAGARFHPECFICFHCGEALECIAFYPEPSERRAERLARAERRRDAETLEQEDDGAADEQDGDDSLRFYCHLDYHEFFSPRCKSCKTPIEGEVIVACGAEWHVGHFFCAQCGDPFDPSTPFVERDGYAWCVSCHTNRTSTRCKKCKKPVVDTVVKAMDAEWHEECFRCADCNGTFDDGRYFVKGQSQEPVCFACGERRLKA